MCIRDRGGDGAEGFDEWVTVNGVRSMIMASGGDGGDGANGQDGGHGAGGPGGVSYGAWCDGPTTVRVMDVQGETSFQRGEPGRGGTGAGVGGSRAADGVLGDARDEVGCRL